MSLGFIILRHVNSQQTNEYWIEAYRCIRRLYPDSWVLIVDDNSIQSLVVCNFTPYRCKVIQSEFPKAGELLGYYYFYKTKMFSQAVILHDSVFLKQKLPPIKEPVKFLWHFLYPTYYPREEKQFVRKLLHYQPLLYLYEKKNAWCGCFGVQSVIHLDFLEFLEKKYGLFQRLLPTIRNRFDRQCIERVFALVCSAEYSNLTKFPSLFGDIHQYGLPWGFTFDKYLEGEYLVLTKKPLDAIKVWTGR